MMLARKTHLHANTTLQSLSLSRSLSPSPSPLPGVGYPWPAARPCSVPLWVVALQGWSWAGQLSSAWTTALTHASITGPSASRSRTMRALGRWGSAITLPQIHHRKTKLPPGEFKVLLNSLWAFFFNEKVQSCSAVTWNWHWKALNAVQQRQFWPSTHPLYSV